MAGPAQVRFPGEDKHKRVRMRGIKKASESIQKRLLRNLERMLDEPAHIIPDKAADGRWPRRDPLVRTIKEVKHIIEKRNDRKWLRRRMVRRRGDNVAQALAGTMLAANEEEHETVAIFHHPVYGETSYVRRGIGRPAHQASLQNQHDPRFRLLVWEEHAKSGLWFFTTDDGVHCSGVKARPPDGWVDEGLAAAAIELRSGDGVWWSAGLDEEKVRDQSPTSAGWIRLTLEDGTVVGVSARELRRSKENFIPSLSLRMLPPKLSAMSEAEWVWAPGGWPAGRSLPEGATAATAEVMRSWLDMEIEDSELAGKARAAAVGCWDVGVMVGERWFERGEDWSSAIDGGDLERQAVHIALDSLEGGLHIRRDGVMLDLHDDVLRIEEVNANALLTTLWDEHGGHIIGEMFDLQEDEADEVADRPRRKGQGFNAFLKSLDEELGNRRRLARLPWRGASLPSVLGFAHRLITAAHTEGLGSTMASIRKRQDDSEAALGWAWLVAHGRDGSEAWRFEQAARDKGSDWAPALQRLWQVSLATIEGDSGADDPGDSGGDAYIEAMAALRTITGTIPELPDA